MPDFSDEVGHFLIDDLYKATIIPSQKMVRMARLREADFRG
jgi:hypothetical protein